ncbi:hypothetical protein [Inquilinus sp. CAU 1745]|uniref:hypothetical protein n=1 Tax=Inquilinus sp. CAU 1745 TaxID=3140369 RepID=UPI00325BD903
MTLLDIRRRAGAAALIAGAALFPAAVYAQQQPAEDAPAGGATDEAAEATESPPPQEEAEWSILIVGSDPSLSEEEFNQSVIRDLPERLLDPETNFTNSSAYLPENDYRLVMVFHGTEEVDRGALCTLQQDTPEALETAPPRFDDLRQSTYVTAAFCEGDEALRTSDSSMTGIVEPGSTSFKFMVRDAVQQLFPDGYEMVPQPETNIAPAIVE